MEALRTIEVDGPPGFGSVTLCGVGATSRVFRGVDLATGRVVALKRLHRQLVRDDKVLARLKREFDALRSLRHATLVEVANVILWDSDPTLVLEYIEGVDLKEHIERRGRLTADEVVPIARALFDALSLTHGSGIVHRDVKPQNVRLASDGRVVLLDFGSARLDAASQLTGTGTTVGTPQYMAPELFAGPVYDPRVDVYGVGATLYECVTGQPPQTADSLAELAHLRTSVDVIPVKERAPIPDALAHVIDRCLARAPEDRFPTAALAGWSLEHPEFERHFAARRSKHPLCVHCGSAIAKENATCAVCFAIHPFRYEVGPCHVVLRSVENVGRFVEHVVVRFPHFGDPNELHTLVERCAALSFSPQRYVSFVSERDAKTVIAELEVVGARAYTIREPAWWKNLLLGLGFPLWFPLRIPIALMASAGSILSGSPAPRPVMPGVTAFAWCAALLGTVAALVSDVSVAPFVALFASITVAFGLALGMRQPQSGRSASPQPRRVVSELIVAASPATEGKRGAGAASPVLLVVAVALLLFECVGLGMVLSATKHRPWENWGDNSTNVAARGSENKLTTMTPQDIADRWAVQERGNARGGLGTGVVVSLALSALAIGAMARRRARVRRDAAALMAEIDLEKIRTLAQRTMPDRVNDGVQHELTWSRSEDGFTAEAIRRASDLMPLLSNEQGRALTGAIEALVQRERSHRAAERSLLSRCILEADPAQKLRFDLLALEGALEAHAATEWTAQLEQEEEERAIPERKERLRGDR